MLANRAIVHEFLPFVSSIRGGCLVMDVAFAVNQNQLGNHHPLGETEPHKRHHLVTGYEANRKADLKLLGKCLDDLTRLRLGAAFIQGVDCEIESLKTARPVFLLELGHNVRGSLAMGTGCENEFKRNHLAAILAE